jgi:heat shock protein HslJ
MEKPRTGALMIGIPWLIWVGIWIASESVQAQVKPRPEAPGHAVSLAGTKWDLVDVGGHRVPQDGRQPYFVLRAVDRFEGGSSGQLEDASEGCGNHLTGSYRTSGNRLQIEVSTSTLLDCVIQADTPPPQDLRFLRGESRFEVERGILELLDEHGTVKARFVAADRQ